MNPMTILDSILRDWASPRVRRLVHSLILLVGLIVTAWLAADGNWTEAVVALVASTYAGANRANTKATRR